MTQTQQIRQELVDNPDGITPMDALEKFGCFRLGARIHDIKNGVGCDPLDVETINETKGGKTYARYKAADNSGGVEVNYSPKLPKYVKKLAQAGEPITARMGTVGEVIPALRRTLCLDCSTNFVTGKTFYGKCDNCGKTKTVVTQ